MLSLPKFLYHYTSIVALKLILSHKRIKFNRLDNVDDLSEAKTQEGIFLGKMFFISCWTDSEIENISLWNTYTQMKGVRLKLKQDMFKIFRINGRYTKGKMYLDGQQIQGPVNPEKIFNEQYIMVPIEYKDFLNKVCYTDNKNLLKPKTLGKNEQETVFYHRKLCQYKSKEWEFQKEWRFVIFVLPIRNNIETSENLTIKDVVSLTNENYKFDVDNLYLDLKDDAFDKAEIMLGPKSTEETCRRVRLLIDMYAPNVKVSKSSLKGEYSLKIEKSM